MKFLKLAVLICMFATILYALDRIDAFEQQTAIDNLEQTIDYKILQCYINEGRYPGSLEYLQDNYQLSFDSSEFQVYLIPLGENLKPDVTVIENE